MNIQTQCCFWFVCRIMAVICIQYERIQVESKYKEMRHTTLETGGRDSEKTGKGGWATWTAQALFAWTRTHDEPRKSWLGKYIAAGRLPTDTSSDHRAPVRFRTVGAKASLHDACFRVLACCVKRKFSTLSLPSAVENGSFAQLLSALETGHPAAAGPSPAYDFSVFDEQNAIFLVSVLGCFGCFSSGLDNLSSSWSIAHLRVYFRRKIGRS